MKIIRKYVRQAILTEASPVTLDVNVKDTEFDAVLNMLKQTRNFIKFKKSQLLNQMTSI